MKLKLTILGLAIVAFAKPQTPPDPPPSSSGPPNDPAPAPVPIPTTTQPAPPPPSTPAPANPSKQPTPEGPICECGYTYCAKVLKAMEKPWSDGQLSAAYCKTPNAVCDQETPASNVENALFICLCAEPEQKVGDHLELLCGCDTCLNVGPDFRGRCKSPCKAGHASSGGSGGGDGKGGKIRGSNRLGFW
ncbi:uncharacterized protein B0J16DRAFT_168216 [Fusarium flagelliforme]|uniref:Sscrp protein n=1 Tax=Fusarium flagelliforme TaxID=2675880 RepID=A0A395M5D0_9HYPO|nr:uncharacterized protein B0J16DRAFT_168216 [Fusarium flagelliforme]KAH7179236.1 hypothetical protein B0J16DRAFT_168216 [Fusarium flagelliforme]RFN42886.1 sscrp protein [Fusarium flagelliforme]